jgi:hypothetical protein
MAKERSAAELQKQLDAILATIERQGYKTDQQAAAQERIEVSLKKQNALQAESLETTKEIDVTLQSIASSYGKQSKIYKKTQAQLGVIQGSVESIESWSSKWVGAAKKGKEEIIGAAKGYRNVNAQVLKNVALIAEGKETYENINDLIDDQVTKHKEVLASITSNTAQSKKLKAEIQGEIDAMEKLAKGAKKAESNISAIAREGEKFAGTMLGGGIDKTLKAFGSKKGLGGVIDKIKTSAGTTQSGGGMGGMLGNVMGGVSKFLGPIGLAVGGIMAAAEFFNSGGAAKMAMRLATLTGEDPMKASDSAFKKSQQYRDLIVEQRIGLPVKLRQQAETDFQEYSISVAEDAAKYKESLISDEIDYRMSLESDAIQFRQQQASMELDAQLSRQKTLFTTGMGYAKQAIGISERALMAIGSSTAAVLDTVKEYGYTLGVALKDQIALSAAAQGLGVRYGTSATEVFKMADTFRLMNKSSAKVGANLVAGLEVLAKDNDMSPAQLYKEMADAQADILKYSSYTTEEYARQAIQLGNMNTSMTSMMKASDSMVLNYKDSIKAEMSLSAMLGKNVNLSEVRAKLMSGDQAGGAAALKTALGGQDINAMNAFQKQALSQATGMGIQELMQLTQSKGDGKVKGSLEERNALKTGKAIAQGALSQDIANAAAKLALDQKNRAEMLKFEQAKRLSMLFVEQKFRLNAIAREFQYREDRETLSAKQAIENAQVSMLKEVSAEQIMSLTNAYSDSFGPGKADAAKVAAYQAKISQDMNVLQQAMIQGRISDTEMGKIQGEIFKAALKGEQVDMSKFTGVQTYQKEQTVLAVATDKRNTEIVTALENLERIETERDKNGNLKNTGYQMQAARDKVDALAPNILRDFKNSKRYGGMGGKAYVEQLRNQKLGGGIAPDGTPAPTINKPMPVSVVEKKTGSNVDSKPVPVPLPPNATKLSDTQAQTKLQVQMVKLIGISAQYLGEINSNTAKTGTSIGGKLISQTLLNQASRTFAIAGVPQY